MNAIIKFAAALLPVVLWLVMHAIGTWLIGKIVGWAMEKYVFGPVKTDNLELDDADWERIMHATFKDRAARA